MGAEQVVLRERLKVSFLVYKMVLCLAGKMALMKAEMLEMN